MLLLLLLRRRRRPRASVKSPDRTSEGPISPPAGARPGGRKSLAERMAEKHGIALEQKS